MGYYPEISNLSAFIAVDSRANRKKTLGTPLAQRPSPKAALGREGGFALPGSGAPSSGIVGEALRIHLLPPGVSLQLLIYCSGNQVTEGGGAL